MFFVQSLKLIPHMILALGGFFCIKIPTKNNSFNFAKLYTFDFEL